MSKQFVITAHRLRDGEVVFYTSEGGWSEWFKDGVVCPDKAAVEATLADANAGDAPLVVVAPYAIEVVEEGGTTLPKSKRERIRAKGPTVRTDLGKQAR